MSVEKSIKELRKELKEKRGATVKPPSKMKKHEILMELGSREQEVLKMVEKVVPPKDKPVVKKAEKAMLAIHKEETAVEKDKPRKKAPKKPAAARSESPKPRPKGLPKPDEVKPAKTVNEGVKKLVKGSQEARDFMAKIREARKTKKESVA